MLSVAAGPLGSALAATSIAAWLMVLAGVGKRKLSWRPRRRRPRPGG